MCALNRATPGSLGLWPAAGTGKRPPVPTVVGRSNLIGRGVRSLGSGGKRGKIILLHFAGRMPLAGIAWQAMHYLLGLRQLDWDAWYVEDSGANPYDPRAESVAMSSDYNIAYLRRAMARHGFGERWVYWDAINDVHHGLGRDGLRALYGEADGLINL